MEKVSNFNKQKLSLLNVIEKAVNNPDEFNEGEVLSAANMSRFNLEEAINQGAENNHIRDVKIAEEICNVLKLLFINGILPEKISGENIRSMVDLLRDFYVYKSRFCLTDFQQLYKVIFEIWTNLPEKKSLLRLLLFMTQDTPWALQDITKLADSQWADAEGHEEP